MSNNTGIEWTDATWNPIRGCTPVSPGCKNCYAAKIAKRFSGPGQAYEGLVRINKAGERTDDWNGKIRNVEKHLLDPLKWRGKKLYHPAFEGSIGSMPGMRIFVNSMSDLFHPNVPDEWIDRIFAVMALCPQHTFQVLTKRPERMLAWFNLKRDVGMSKTSAATTAWHVWSKVPDIQNMVRRETRCPFMWDQQAPDADAILGWPLPNVHLGVSVEDQKTADERIPLLLKTPAAVRFISAEPLLGAITFRWAKWDNWGSRYPHFENVPVADSGRRMTVNHLDGLRMLDWVICGGESGSGARPMYPDWARGLRDQCVAAGVPFFFKQWGEHLGAMQDGAALGSSQAINASDEPVRTGKKAAGSLLDGREWKEFPRG